VVVTRVAPSKGRLFPYRNSPIASTFGARLTPKAQMKEYGVIGADVSGCFNHVQFELSKGVGNATPN